MNRKEYNEFLDLQIEYTRQKRELSQKVFSGLRSLYGNNELRFAPHADFHPQSVHINVFSGRGIAIDFPTDYSIDTFLDNPKVKLREDELKAAKEKIASLEKKLQELSKLVISIP